MDSQNSREVNSFHSIGDQDIDDPLENERVLPSHRPKGCHLLPLRSIPLINGLFGIPKYLQKIAICFFISMETVFSIRDVHIHILSFLSISDILRCSSVSKMWNR